MKEIQKLEDNLFFSINCINCLFKLNIESTIWLDSIN